LRGERREATHRVRDQSATCLIDLCQSAVGARPRAGEATVENGISPVNAFAVFVSARAARTYECALTASQIGGVIALIWRHDAAGAQRGWEPTLGDYPTN